MSIKFSCVTLRHMSFEHALVALQRGTFGNPADGDGADGLLPLEGGGQHPQERQNRHQQNDRKHQVKQRPAHKAHVGGFTHRNSPTFSASRTVPP